MNVQLARLAIRNVFRNKRRTFLTLGAIVFGCIGMIIFGGYIEYLFWGLRESTIRGQTGHVQLYRKGFSEKGAINPLEYTIPNFREIRDEAVKLPYVEKVSTQLTFNGLISTGERTGTFVATGIEKDDPTIGTWLTIIEGRSFDKLDEKELSEAVTIAQGLRGGISAVTGQYLTLMTSTKGGGLNAMDAKLEGVFRTGAKEFDDVAIKVPLAAAQRLLATEDVTRIMLFFKTTDDMERGLKDINALIAAKQWELEIKTWEELTPIYGQVVGFLTGIFNFLKLIMTIVVVFSIANTLMMSVMERVTEIGTLRAIGTDRRMIMKIFLMEGVSIGVLGGAAGVILAIIIASIVNIKGFYVPPPPLRTEGFQAYITIVPSLLAFAFFLSTITAFVASIFPARKAARMVIVDAIRHI